MTSADYIVTGTQYDATKKHITGYEVRQVRGNRVDAPFIAPWANIAKAILGGTKFVTATLGTAGWILGAPLQVVVKTVEDTTVRDNLSHLPAVA